MRVCVCVGASGGSSMCSSFNNNVSIVAAPKNAQKLVLADLLLSHIPSMRFRRALTCTLFNTIYEVLCFFLLFFSLSSDIIDEPKRTNCYWIHKHMLENLCRRIAKRLVMHCSEYINICIREGSTNITTTPFIFQWATSGIIIKKNTYNNNSNDDDDGWTRFSLQI